MSRQPHQIVFAVANAPKKGRKSGAKSRNGCLTCKVRHIKCTEEKPVCKRCTSTGKQCAGYAPQARDHSSPRGGTPPSRSSSPTSAMNDLALTVSAALGLPSKHIDRRYLDHFRNRSAKALSRLGDQEFWSDVVLRLSASRPMIQYAMLALSAQHEAHLEGRIVALDGAGAAAVYGLGQYSKGIKCLNQTLANSTSGFDLLEVIVACVLFASFEILQGNGNGAMRHGRGGLQILLGQMKQHTEGSNVRDNYGELEAVLDSKPAKFLIRLDVDTATYGGLQDVHELAMPPSRPSLTLEDQETAMWPPKPAEKACVFESIVKAREDLYAHLARNYYFERNIGSVLRSSTSQDAFDTMYHDCPDSLGIPYEYDVHHWQEVLLTNMRNWNTRLQALVEPQLSAPWNDTAKWAGGAKTKSALIREYASISVACMSSFMSIYTCLAAEDDAQGLYDSLLPQFQCLVQYAEVIVLPELSLNTRSDDWEWSVLDMQGIIQSLAFAALKCRDRALRNHAVFLLSMVGRRGGWDGQNMARLVRSVVEYEEKNAREEGGIVNICQDEPLWIPLCARVSRIELDIDKAKQTVRIWMKCARDVNGFTEQLDLVDEHNWESESCVDFDRTL